MDPSAVRTIPLHLAMFGIISPSNAPLYVHSYTGPQDELRYHHLAHASLDIFEERESSADKVPENFVGLLFSMDDLVLYGYRTATDLRIVIGLALIDGTIKDVDALTICRAVHQIYIKVSSNPFLPLDASNSFSPDRLSFHHFANSKKMQVEASKLGRLLNGGRAT